MPLPLIPVLLLELLYAVACVTVGTRPGASLWLRWPTLTWERMVHGPAPKPRPNYARIAYLEQELGLVDPEPVRKSSGLGISAAEAQANLAANLNRIFGPERAVRADKVCLVKGCDGPTTEIRNWDGVLRRRLHQH
ncbi:hypothetical protein [Streptomyces sp. H27-H5]|uniref:hypothetical protein n=1 Tax=Streptomyces sp. H27-H5 TaxID=2996460 RepID=UPI0022720061|nr:hypothetical protein [Streptomyces sp. H27-H5]MCY0960839.1 hypothetical protein [Streptomyces sp. H27-H5]